MKLTVAVVVPNWAPPDVVVILIVKFPWLDPLMTGGVQLALGVELEGLFVTSVVVWLLESVIVKVVESVPVAPVTSPWIVNESGVLPMMQKVKPAHWDRFGVYTFPFESVIWVM